MTDRSSSQSTLNPTIGAEYTKQETNSASDISLHWIVQVRLQFREKREQNKINWWTGLKGECLPLLHALKLLVCYANLGQGSWFSPRLLLICCNTLKQSQYGNPLHGACNIRCKTFQRKHLSDSVAVSAICLLIHEKVWNLLPVYIRLLSISPACWTVKYCLF